MNHEETPETAMLRDTVRRFVENEMPRELARECDREMKFPADVYARLKKSRLMIERNNKQAKLIHQATKKLVLCVESGVMYGAKV